MEPLEAGVPVVEVGPATAVVQHRDAAGGEAVAEGTVALDAALPVGEHLGERGDAGGVADQERIDMDDFTAEAELVARIAEIDLEDVEAQLGEEPQAGVAGADVVRGEADGGSAARLDAAADPARVEQALALGELDDQAVGREVVPRQDGEQRARVELGRLDRGRLEVERQELVRR